MLLKNHDNGEVLQVCMNDKLDQSYTAEIPLLAHGDSSSPVSSRCMPYSGKFLPGKNSAKASAIVLYKKFARFNFGL